MNHVTKSPESVTSGDSSERDERAKGELKSAVEAFADLPADQMLSADPQTVPEIVLYFYDTDPEFCSRLSDAQVWAFLVECGLIPSGTPISEVAEALAPTRAAA